MRTLLLILVAAQLMLSGCACNREIAKAEQEQIIRERELAHEMRGFSRGVNAAIEARSQSYAYVTYPYYDGSANGYIPVDASAHDLARSQPQIQALDHAMTPPAYPSYPSGVPYYWR